MPNLSDILKIRATYKNISRISQILNVFIKHGFGQFIEVLNLHRLIPFRKRIKIITEGGIPESTSMAEKLRIAFTELGPSYIKLAQLLSTRPDLITERYAEEFSKLQDRVPPFPFADVKNIIERDIGKRLDEMFIEIDEIPIAAASIGQVHKAILKDGSSVVVKVQRPNIAVIIEKDISIMRTIANLMVKYIPESEMFNPVGIVEEFSKAIRKELNFIEETKNIKIFAKNFKNVSKVKIPTVYSEYISTHVIVMEWIEGTRIDNIPELEKRGINKHDVAQVLVDSYFKMILEDGFFHADPHPGNLFVLQDGTIGIVDFGMAAWLTPDVMESIAAMLVAVVRKDYNALIDQFIELGMITDEMDFEKIRGGFMSDLIEILVPLYESPLTEINVAEYLDAVTRISVKHKLQIPSSMILIDKCLLIVEKIVRELDNNFNVITAATPYTAALIRKRYGPKRMFTKIERHMTELSDSLIATPKKVRLLLRRMINNEFAMKINLVGIERMIRDIDRSTNRLAFSIIVASIILSSSILTLSGVGGRIFDMPAIGTVGFIMAFFLGVWLLISILRSGRL